MLELQVPSALSPLSKPKREAGMHQPQKTLPRTVKAFPTETVTVPSLGGQVLTQTEGAG